MIRYLCVLISTTKYKTFLGKSAPRMLRKSRIDQANAIELENNEKAVKTIIEEASPKEESFKEGILIKFTSRGGPSF